MFQAGGKIYFTAEVAKAIGRVDPATNKVDWVLGTGQDISHMVVVSPDLKRLFTVNVQSASASVMERAVGRAGRFAPAADDDWTVTSTKVGDPADDFEGFDVSPDGRELWTASPRGKIAIVDTIGKKLLQALDVPAVSGANRVKFTPDGKHVLISRLSGGAILGRRQHRRLRRGDPRGDQAHRRRRRRRRHPDAAGRRSGIRFARTGVVVIDLKTLRSSDGLTSARTRTAWPGRRAPEDHERRLNTIWTVTRALAGDPNRVTVFGQSTGGLSACALVYLVRRYATRSATWTGV